MANIYAKTDGQLADLSKWNHRHNSAVGLVRGGITTPANPEHAVVRLLDGWEAYAKSHKSRYESLIGSDYVLGPAWQRVGEGIRALLNGETGRLDCGTLDAFILDTLSENGVDTENL
jgi:hypothetical protein